MEAYQYGYNGGLQLEDTNININNGDVVVDHWNTEFKWWSNNSNISIQHEVMAGGTCEYKRNS